MSNKNINICILDYGSGNVKSVLNLINSITGNVKISNAEEDIKSASHLVLPGVGSFGAAMKKVRKNIPIQVLEHEVHVMGKPFLGICVGMQILADKGFEHGEFDGLGWVSGETTKLESGDWPLPHIGWNNLEIISDSPILNEIDEGQDFYFVHSFAFRQLDDNCVVAKTDYGEHFTSLIQKDNIFGVQFHPEKSQNAGKLFIKNFLSVYEEK